MAMEAWYKDEDCKIPHGPETWYHSNKVLKSTGKYANGVKEGTWLVYGEGGGMIDSATYANGKLVGIRLRWNAEGIQYDSTNFDGKGNGVQVSWYNEGVVSSSGYWISDTLKKGRWNYYFPNGKQKATEDYVEGKRIAASCYDSAGNRLPDGECVESEAQFKKNWAQYMAKTLNANVAANNGAPTGKHTVIIQFVIDKDGSISDIKRMTNFGYGMEEEVERVIKTAPQWIPAKRFGQPVKAYRLQPITFVVEETKGKKQTKE
jgi:antitoxin component YwqK of YwqJK toxin-antitoxin module